MSRGPWFRAGNSSDLEGREFIRLGLDDHLKPTESPSDLKLNTPTEAPPLPAIPLPIPIAGPWNRRYLLLALALIPLFFSLLSTRNERDIERHISQSIAKLPVTQQIRIVEGFSKRNLTVQGFTMLLPGHRIEGALLGSDSWIHWLYAAASAGVFLVFLILAFPPSRATPRQAALAGVFTGTIGIVLLLAFQIAAAVTQGIWFKGFGIVTAIFYIVKFIGFSYAAALDPKSSFLLSCMGFTFGVGFCEEVCKILPLVRHFRYWGTLDWRGACFWGLASGVGFGVSEGITYASSYYNGIQSGEIYAVRFISCVALHAVWSCAAAVTLVERQESLQTHSSILEFIWRLLRIVAVPMVLHGLYDTLLKKDMRALALVAAIASFGWMVYQLERSRRREPSPLQEGEPALTTA